MTKSSCQDYKTICNSKDRSLVVANSLERIPDLKYDKFSEFEAGISEEIMSQKVWIGDLETKWEYCLQPDGHETYTHTLNVDVMEVFETTEGFHSILNGSFIGWQSNPTIQTIELVNAESKVYYKVEDSLYVLYDFSVGAGDTLSLRFPIEIDDVWHESNPDIDPYFKIQIDSIGSIEIDDQQLKRVYFHQVDKEDTINGDFISTPVDLGGHYTEKVGYENFIIPYIVTGYDENNTNCDLNKFQNESIHWINNNAYCMGVSAQSIQSDNGFRLRPNPAFNILNIGTEITPERVEILDFSGQYVRQYSHTQSIDVSSLSAGVYIAKVIVNGQIAYRNFIKQ